jgi:hypothetical protein
MNGPKTISVYRVLTIWAISLSVMIGAPHVTKIKEIPNQPLKKYVTVAGMIKERKGGKGHVFLTLADDTGTVTIPIFKNTSISKERLQEGTSIMVHGKVDLDRGALHRGEFEVIPEYDGDITYPSEVSPPRPNPQPVQRSPLEHPLLQPKRTVMPEVETTGPTPQVEPPVHLPSPETLGVKTPGPEPSSVSRPILIVLIVLVVLVGLIGLVAIVKLKGFEKRLGKTEFEARVRAETQHQVGLLADENDLLIKRVMALIPQEGSQPPEFLRDATIRSQFLDGIKNAKTRIDIESPWITSWVIQQLLSPLEAALKHGVRIRIVYGFKMPGAAIGPKEVDTEKQAAKLREQWKGYDFKMRFGPTHGKAFICDEKFLLLGSYNFLSFAGIFNVNTNSEIVTKIRDKKVIQELRTQTFDF